jgi:hypothetical protein
VVAATTVYHGVAKVTKLTKGQKPRFIIGSSFVKTVLFPESGSLDDSD